MPQENPEEPNPIEEIRGANVAPCTSPDNRFRLTKEEADRVFKNFQRMVNEGVVKLDSDLPDRTGQ